MPAPVPFRTQGGRSQQAQGGRSQSPCPDAPDARPLPPLPPLLPLLHMPPPLPADLERIHRAAPAELAVPTTCLASACDRDESACDCDEPQGASSQSTCHESTQLEDESEEEQQEEEEKEEEEGEEEQQYQDLDVLLENEEKEEEGFVPDWSQSSRSSSQSRSPASAACQQRAALIKNWKTPHRTSEQACGSEHGEEGQRQQQRKRRRREKVASPASPPSPYRARGGVTEGEGESGISGRKSSEGEGDGARTLTMGLVCEFIVGLRDFIS